MKGKNSSKKGGDTVSELSIAISIAGLFGSISSIVFAYLAFKRNETNDAKEQGENTGEIQAIVAQLSRQKSKIFIMN